MWYNATVKVTINVSHSSISTEGFPWLKLQLSAVPAGVFATSQSWEHTQIEGPRL